tara:strand:- start:195 stop:359 length:165 start_codon:yes stop_codon:yes gene_type:complete
MIKYIKINVGGEKIVFNPNSILNEVFKNHIKDLQKPERTKMPALDDDGKFVRYE